VLAGSFLLDTSPSQTSRLRAVTPRRSLSFPFETKGWSARPDISTPSCLAPLRYREKAKLAVALETSQADGQRPGDELKAKKLSGWA
jgi:hypothetical protein